MNTYYFSKLSDLPLNNIHNNGTGMSEHSSFDANQRGAITSKCLKNAQKGYYKRLHEETTNTIQG